MIPQNKEDIDFIIELKTKSIIEIREIIPSLLEWMQDMNWPQASLLAKYFCDKINDIDDEIIFILNGNDDTWKYSVLFGLVLNSKIIPNSKILSIVQRINNHPSYSEQEEEIDVLAKEILTKYSSYLTKGSR